MGIDVQLQDERGNKLDEVPDPTNRLAKILPSPDDESFVCLRFIDAYGDTTFNKFQMRALVPELERVRAKTETQGDRELLDRIIALARRCETHLYVKFIGD